MIGIEKVSKRFGKLDVLKEISLSCQAGECIALIGPNGCGKTTLIKSVLGMVMPDSGQILFDGLSIASRHDYRARIGFMPQIGRYPENMTVGQVIEMIIQIREHNGRIDDELMRSFRIDEITNKRMNTLSGGTTQKVSATLAFLFEPEVLILDEPTAGLDPLSSEMLKEKIISAHKAGRLVIITSHILSELDELITQIVYMEEGRVQFHRPVNELMSETGEEKISRAIAQCLKSRRS